MESEIVLEQHDDASSVSNQEDIRTQLLKSEQQKEKLRTNLKKLKEKMIDTNMMVNLFTKTKEALRQTEVKLDEERKEKTNLRLQLEQVLQETQPLRDKLLEANDKNISLQSNLDKLQAQLRSTLAYNSQLKAQVDARSSSKDEIDTLKKECKGLKKELQSKTNRVLVLESDLSTLKRQLEEKRKEIAMLEERNKELQQQAPNLSESFSETSKVSPEKLKRKKKTKEQEVEKSTQQKKRKVKKDDEAMAPPLMNKFEPVTDAAYPVPFTESIGRDLNESDSETENQISQMLQELDEESEHDEIEVSLGAPIPYPVNPQHTRKPEETLFDYILKEVSLLQDSNFDDVLIALTEEISHTPDATQNLADAVVMAVKNRTRTDILPDDELIHCLLWYILESVPSVKHRALDYLLQHLGSLILTAPDDQIEQTVPLCSLFASLCKFNSDIQRVRVLLYDVLRERPFMEIWTVTAIASVWPHSLNYQDGNNILLKTIESIVTFFCQELQSSESKELKLYQLLKSTCNWQLTPSVISFEGLVADAVRIISNEREGKENVHNAMKSLELIASNQGWPWCYNTIIVGQLWPLMQPGKYSHPAMLTAVRLFGILGRTVISSLQSSDEVAETAMLQSAANMDGIVLLRNRLEMILSRQVIQFSLDAEIMAALSLVDLSFGLPHYLASVKNWAASLTAQQRNELSPNLQNVLHLIQ